MNENPVGWLAEATYETGDRWSARPVGGGARIDPAPIAVETMTLSYTDRAFEVGDEVVDSAGDRWTFVGGSRFEKAIPIQMYERSRQRVPEPMAPYDWAPLPPGNRHERRRAAALARRR